jgi:hypothetical protein
MTKKQRAAAVRKKNAEKIPIQIDVVKLKMYLVKQENDQKKRICTRRKEKEKT